MAGIIRFGLATVLGVALFAGCSRNATPDATAADSANGSQTTAQTDTSSSPIAQAASEWLDAVIKGDTQRATARLTPQAKQQIIKSDMQFSPSQFETARFQIGEVRTPAQDQAIVQCVLNYSANGTARSEELCCLLRLVDNDWQVAGIAYGTGPDKPWTLTNFETGKDVPIPRQDMSAAGTASTDISSPPSRPSPPRTAQEAPATSPTAERR